MWKLRQASKEEGAKEVALDVDGLIVDREDGAKGSKNRV